MGRRVTSELRPAARGNIDVEFNQHYTRNEARALLPQIKEWLGELEDLRQQLEKHESRLAGIDTPHRDLGGDLVNSWVRVIAQMKTVLTEFLRREIQIKDLDRGLVDFPALIDGKEVFLCWEKSEADIEFWHDLQAGYAGRQPLEDTEDEE